MVAIATEDKKLNGCWMIKVSCPFCDKVHLHGADDGNEPDLETPMSPHCIVDYTKPMVYYDKVIKYINFKVNEPFNIEDVIAKQGK